MALGAEGTPEVYCQQHTRGTAGEAGGCESPGEVCPAGFPHMNSVLIIGGAQVLTVGEDGCGSLWRNPGPYLERCFLAERRSLSLLAQPLHPTGSDFLASTADL